MMRSYNASSMVLLVINVGSSKGNVLGYGFLLTSFDSGQLITWELARPGETPESPAVHGSKKYLTALLVFA